MLKQKANRSVLALGPASGAGISGGASTFEAMKSPFRGLQSFLRACG